MDNIVRYGTVVVLVAFPVVLCVIVVLLSTMQENTQYFKEGKMCFPDDDGTYQCGFEMTLTSEQIEALTSKILNKMETHEIYQSNDFHKQRQFIKLIGTEKPYENRVIHSKEDKMTKIEDWQHDQVMHDGKRFGSSQFKYKNGRVEVPVDGQYYVYSFIELKMPAAKSSGIQKDKALTIPIKHSIFLIYQLEIDETEVATSVQTYELSDNDSVSVYSSDVSSLLKMSAGDAVSIRISNITLLNNSKNNEFVVRLIQQM